MSKKFKIKQNPTFKADVEIPLVGGKSITTNMEFKYFTRKELARIYDGWSKQAEELKFEDVSLEELTQQEIDLQVRQIKDIVSGWDIEDEFNDENIEAFVDMTVHAAKAVVDTFQEAYQEARKGN